MSEEKKLSVIKVTLNTGKVVLLHEMLISHTEKAAKQIASEAGDSQQLFALLMQKALVQQLLFQIDGKVVSMAERDRFDKLFTTAEYGQILRVIGKINGGDDVSKEAKIELVAADS